MFGQTPINRLNGVSWDHHSTHNCDRPNNEVTGVRDLMADLTELVELQGRLIVDDAQRSLNGAVKPIVILVCAGLVMLSTMPVLLLALSNVFVSEFVWPIYAAQFASAGIGLLVSLGLFGCARHMIRNNPRPLQQSMAELEKNLRKFREMLVGTSVKDVSSEQL